GQSAQSVRATVTRDARLRPPAGRSRTMSTRTADGELSLRQSVIKQQCLVLRLPTLASQCGPLAEQAERERQPYLGYLEALLAAELEERERRAIDRRIKDAHLPRVKTLDEFDFRQAPMVSPTRMSELAEGGYIERAEPIVFIGDSGTGKTHLVSALVVAACRHRKRARFITAAALVNELVEAKQQLQLRRVLGRWDSVGARGSAMTSTPLRNDSGQAMTRLCQRCGNSFVAHGRRRFCDDACRQAAWRERHPAATVPTLPRKLPRSSVIYECPEC